MTNLQCSVTDCINNESNCCCRPDIMVSGKSACDREQTSCSDFEKKSGEGAQNSCGCSTPNQQMHVRCEAEKCIYNQHGDCDASNIEVRDCSCQEATCKSETECHTFKMQ